MVSTSFWRDVYYVVSSPPVLLGSRVTLATLVALLLSYAWWKSLKSSRASKLITRDGAVPSLPTPAMVLPTWCGFIGGHSLLLKQPKVRLLKESAAITAHDLPLPAPTYSTRQQLRISYFKLGSRLMPPPKPKIASLRGKKWC